MKFDIKIKKSEVTRVLLGISFFLAVLMLGKVAAFSIMSKGIGGRIEAAMASSKPDEETVRRHLSRGRETVGKMGRKNIFAPPPPGAKAPVCMGIIGDCAIINGKYYWAGDMIGAAKVLDVGTTDVTIMWEGNEKKLVPFLVPTKYSSKKPSKSVAMKPEERRPEQSIKIEIQQTGRGGGPGFGRGGPGSGFGGGMSIEQMQKIREKYMSMSSEERERFRSDRGSGGGFGGGGRPGGGYGDRSGGGPGGRSRR